MSATAFLKMMKHRAPALVVENDWASTRKRTFEVPVRHRLGAPATAAATREFNRLLKHSSFAEMRTFFRKHDGARLCIAFDPLHGDKRALVTVHGALEWAPTTEKYVGDGEWAWTVDLCRYRKAPSFYRGKDPWLVIATIGDGPRCLTTFTAGPNAGQFFFLAPEPAWNILVPIAKSFGALLDRMTEDLAMFLRRVQATVAMRSPRGEPWGLHPQAYLARRH